MSTIQDTDLLLVNRGGTDHKVTAEDLYVYFNPQEIVYHIINIQNVTGSPDPLQAKNESSSVILENLTTGDKKVLGNLTTFDLIEGNEYLITLTDVERGYVQFLGNKAYTWDFGPKCDTKLLTSMYALCYKSVEFDGDLSNLDVSNVKDMHNTFAGDPWNKMKCTLKGVEKWDVSNVTSFWQFSINNVGLTDLTAVKDWDVSSGENFASMFGTCQSLLSAKAVEGWNTKSADDMAYMFQDSRNMTEVSDFSQWCVPDVTRMGAFNKYNEDKVIEPIWGTCPRGEDKA